MARWCSFLALGGLLLGASIASAQMFGGESIVTSKEPRTETAQPSDASKAPDLKELVSDESVGKALADEKNALEQEQMMENVFVPGGGLDIINRPTEDGSKRGGMAVVEINEDGYSRRAEKIFLYYDNFKISGYLSNSASCSMRFIVLNNLDRKLVSLDVKLVWPEMTTALSFSNVEPNTPTYLNYTLMGSGCYNMDKMPNIIVNRCRVRGMNSAECADKIVWLSAAQNK